MSTLKTLTINGKTYSVVPVVPAASVTLLADGWVGSEGAYSQVVELAGVTSHTKVDLQPTPEQLEEFHYKVLAFVAENDGGVVTVYAIGDKPSNDHTIQITLTEVEATGKIRGNTVGTTMPRANLQQEDPKKADYVFGKDAFLEAAVDVALNKVKEEGGNGNGGIHIGSEPPEDENVTVWIDTDEEPEASGGEQADWNAAEGEPGHVLNRTHWEESEHKVLLDTTVTTANNTAYLQQKIELQEGQTCIVTFGGQQYSCTCRYLAYIGFLGLAIGNTYPIDGNNTGEPFMVMYAPLLNVTYVVIMLPDGEHSIKVEGEVKSYHTIPPAFLPKPCWMIEFDLDNPSTDVTRIELDKAIDNGEMIALRGRRYVNATVVLYYFVGRSQEGGVSFRNLRENSDLVLTPNDSGGYDMAYEA